MNRAILLFSLPTVLLYLDALDAQELGYRPENGRIVADEFEHFDAWRRAVGTLELSENATGAFEGIHPRRWRRNINALLSNVVESMRQNPPQRLTDPPPKGRGPIDPADFSLLDAVETGKLNSKQEV